MRICTALYARTVDLALAAAFVWPFAGTPALAASQAERLTYDIMFGGLLVGDMMVVLNQSEAGYKTELHVKSRGMMERFVDARAQVHGEGNFTGLAFNAAPATEALLPARYETQWHAEDVISTRRVSFHPETRLAEATRELRHPVTGKPVTEEELGWNDDDDDDDDDDREVPAAMRTKVFDPMAAFVAARRKVAEGGVSEFRVPVYDGRRRYDVVGAVGEAKPYTIRNVERTLIPIATTLSPVFGFSERGISRVAEAEGRILFTTDGRFIPVQVMVSNNFGTAVMNLTGDCRENAALCDAFSPQQRASTE